MVKRPSPALVIALLALFVALGGTGYAALKISGKNIKPKTIAGGKLKKNTLGGKQIKERKLGKVPAAERADSARRSDLAARADSAARADVASDSESLAGKVPADFAKASQFIQTYTKATRGATAAVFERGPFRVMLECEAVFVSGGVPAARAGLIVESSADSLTSLLPPVTDGFAAAGTPLSTLKTSAARANEIAYQSVGGYVDTTDGVTLDFSSRLRVNGLDVSWCHAVTQATLGGT